MLSKENVNLLHTVNGEDTIKIMDENPDIDLILMDIKMPLMDGLEATRLIREFNKSIPIIAQTAHTFSAEIRKAKDAGCTDYLTKPIKKERLLEMISKYLKRSEL